MDRSRLRRRWYQLLEHSPVLYCGWQRRHHKHRVVDAQSNLVVEGYPGTANTFVREAVQYTNPRIRLASHLHSAAHVRRAVQLGVPVLVLLRAPVDAIASAQARFGWKQVTIASRFDQYERFYQSTLELSDQVALAPFDETINQLGDVVRVVNARFGTGFCPWQGDENDLRRRVHATMSGWTEYVFGPGSERLAAFPSDERAAVITELCTELEGAEYREARARCEVLHDELTRLAQAQFAAVRA